MLKCRPLSPTDLALKYGGLGRLDLLIRTDHPIVQQLFTPVRARAGGMGGLEGRPWWQACGLRAREVFRAAQVAGLFAPVPCVYVCV